MTPKQLEIRLKLKNDLPHFAHKCLNIRTKEGKILPFSFNTAQLYLHSKIEKQKKETGKVRVIVLKGRQQGVSTYIASRYYHIVSHRTGYRAFIMAHKQSATDNLFEMVKRFHQYCPLVVKPIDGQNNIKEFNFLSPESGYKVGTAETKDVGRSSTIQLFHGSEVAFWANADEHSKGIMEAVPLANGTEIILESTANGIGNYFYKIWRDAVAGENGYLAVFIPWFWQKEYSMECPSDFVFSPEELDYMRVFKLTREQMAWRQYKIKEKGSELYFRQEYPSTAEEAFIINDGESLISGLIAERAAKTKPPMASGIKFVGVDPAGQGTNRTSIIRRQGRVAYDLQSYRKKEPMEIVGIVKKIIDEERPDFVCIDVGGLGVGIYDRLKELGYGNIVKPINSGEQAFNRERYANKRAEMWCLLKEWLNEIPVSIPDVPSLLSDICSPIEKWDSLNRVILEKKEDMRKRGISSPDEGDALALTFAFPATTKNVNMDNIFNPDIRF